MDLLAFGKSVLASQPLSILLGCTLNSFETGKAQRELIIDDKHKRDCKVYAVTAEQKKLVAVAQGTIAKAGAG